MQKLLQSSFVTYYGNLFVLLLLCGYYSFATLSEFQPVNRAAGQQLAEFIIDNHATAKVLIIVPLGEQNLVFSDAIEMRLRSAGVVVLDRIQGGPREAESKLRDLGEQQTQLDFVATQVAASRWPILNSARLQQLANEFPSLKSVRVIKPSSYRWPTFLTAGNLRAIVNNISIVAIIAIGMTMVIITAGIDLSVGSLIALSGVVVAVAVRHLSGGDDPTVIGLLLGSLLAVGLCGLFGLFSGMMVTVFDIPAFIVTLALMQIARGMAFLVAGGPTPIEIDSDQFHWFGGGNLWAIPIPVLVMTALYLLAHFVMAHTALGRYIYAVGGNPEAARLSGVPVKRVLLFTYVVCGALAGLAGVIDASLFRVGRATAGTGYELQIIAAVVVGGTSLSGGEGKVLGTLIGALILSVIQNGMNLTNIDSYTQMVVFGSLILAAVLLDRLKTRGARK